MQLHHVLRAYNKDDIYHTRNAAKARNYAEIRSYVPTDLHVCEVRRYFELSPRPSCAHITTLMAMFFLSVADPDPGSGAFLIPGFAMGKISESGSGMNNLDHIFASLETIFWVKILKFFDADPGS